MEKRILVCATGSGALLGMSEYLAYLTATFKHVRIILSKNAENLYPCSAASQLCEVVYTDDIEFIGKKKNHIALARWADIIIVLPMTANTLGKLANGIADTFITTTLLSYEKTVLMYPCMNNIMWRNNLVQRNVSKLKNTNYTIVVRENEETFELASGKMKKNISLPSISELNEDILCVLKENTYEK